MAKRKSSDLQGSSTGTDAFPSEVASEPQNTMHTYKVMYHFLPSMLVEAECEQKAIDTYNRLLGITKFLAKHIVTLVK